MFFSSEWSSNWTQIMFTLLTLYLFSFILLGLLYKFGLLIKFRKINWNFECCLFVQLIPCFAQWFATSFIIFSDDLMYIYLICYWFIVFCFILMIFDVMWYHFVCCYFLELLTIILFFKVLFACFEFKTLHSSTLSLRLLDSNSCCEVLTSILKSHTLTVIPRGPWLLGLKIIT